MKLTSQHLYEYHAPVMARLPDLTHKATLDVGCGRGVWGFLLRTSKKCECLIGLDINPYYLHLAKKHNIYDHLVRASADYLPFGDRSMDVVICVEVLEHLPQHCGHSLLNEVDRVMRNFALLTTPNGYLSSMCPSNIFEVHRSGWNSDQLKSKGYQVFGMGLKLYSKYPSKLTCILQYVLYPFASLIPQISATLLAVKTNERKSR
jgi:SAM-dependent methyltransferase